MIRRKSKLLPGQVLHVQPGAPGPVRVEYLPSLGLGQRIQLAIEAPDGTLFQTYNGPDPPACAECGQGMGLVRDHYRSKIIWACQACGEG